MLPAYSHVPMRIGYLSEANDSHVRLLEVTVFANTSFTFPPGSFPEHRPSKYSLVAYHLHNCCIILRQRCLGECGARL